MFTVELSRISVIVCMEDGLGYKEVSLCSRLSYERSHSWPGSRLGNAAHLHSYNHRLTDIPNLVYISFFYLQMEQREYNQLHVAVPLPTKDLIKAIPEPQHSQDPSSPNTNLQPTSLVHQSPPADGMKLQVSARRAFESDRSNPHDPSA